MQFLGLGIIELIVIERLRQQRDIFVACAHGAQSAGDDLRGLKENVIVGRLIPAGTGYKFHADQRRTREELLAEELQGLAQEQADEKVEAPIEISAPADDSAGASAS